MPKTIPELSKIIGVSRQRTHQLVREGRIRAQKIGSQYVIDDKEVLRITNRHKRYRKKNSL